MYTLSAPYFAAQVAAAVDQAKKAGCEVSQSDGQNDMGKQIADVEDMVAKGVNLLILNPRDPEGLVAAADAATKAGVKVVVMDSSINPKAHVITQVRSSNDQNGYLVGQWLAKQMQGKPIKIILLSGSQGNEVGHDRRLGVFKGLIEGQLVNEGQAGFVGSGPGLGLVGAGRRPEGGGRSAAGASGRQCHSRREQLDGSRRDEGARKQRASPTCWCSPPPMARKRRSPSSRKASMAQPASTIRTSWRAPPWISA